MVVPPASAHTGLDSILRLTALLTHQHGHGVTLVGTYQGDYDGRGQPTASPMLTAIMSGEVGISGRELYKYR